MKRSNKVNVFYEKLSDEDVAKKLEGLIGWESDNGRIFKRFDFNSYDETIDFVNKVAEIANAINHHPDMNVSFKFCVVNFSTHAVDGLSILDFISAARLDLL